MDNFTPQPDLVKVSLSNILPCKAKVIQYEKELHILNKVLMETKDEEMKRKEELEKFTVTFDFLFTLYQENVFF